MRRKIKDATQEGGKGMKISIEAARVNAGMNKKTASIALGLSIPTITKIEEGKRGLKPIELEGISAMYGIPKGNLIYQPYARA